METATWRRIKSDREKENCLKRIQQRMNTACNADDNELIEIEI